MALGFACRVQGDTGTVIASERKPLDLTRVVQWLSVQASEAISGERLVIFASDVTEGLPANWPDTAIGGASSGGGGGTGSLTQGRVSVLVKDNAGSDKPAITGIKWRNTDNTINNPFTFNGVTWELSEADAGPAGTYQIVVTTADNVEHPSTFANWSGNYGVGWFLHRWYNGGNNTTNYTFNANV